VTIFGTAIDVRPLFPRERRALLGLLGSLEPGDWSAATICPGWDVHDVVGHILHDYVRRLSGGRDGHHGAAPADDESLAAYLARENEVFVRAARRCSPRVLIDLLAHLGPQLDALWSARDPHARADTDVSWAATDVPSPAWLDMAREYTEFWVHQQQVRDAVSCPGADEPELMGPVVDTFLRALPHTLRGEARPEGTTVRFEVLGPAGGVWHAVRGAERWRMADGGEPAASVAMDQDTLWRLASRGVTVEEARGRAIMDGDPALAEAATTLLSIIW
jgi:uncharacterized protein (TIGR03083 family)